MKFGTGALVGFYSASLIERNRHEETRQDKLYSSGPPGTAMVRTSPINNPYSDGFPRFKSRNFCTNPASHVPISPRIADRDFQNSPRFLAMIIICSALVAGGVICSFSGLGTKRIACAEQVVTQRPHPIHLSLLTAARLSSSISMASIWQRSRQVSQPAHSSRSTKAK
jgi:hypothetical protein